MAKITIPRIDEISLNVVQEERDINTKGNLRINKRICETYVENGYESKPKTMQEAKARCEQGFNGLSTSFANLQVSKNDDNKIIVKADIAPTRYFVRQATIDTINKYNITSEEEMIQINPMLANVSLIAPVKINGEYHLLGQIKGAAVGSGQMHIGLVAGGIDTKYLTSQNPLITSLQNECSEEIGMDLSTIDRTSFVFMLNEMELGAVNFASIAKNTQLENVLGNYETSVKEKLGIEKLEVAALTSFPVAGLSLIPLEEGIKGMQDLTIYRPTDSGLEVVKETRGIRPYSEAVVGFLENKINREFLLNKAGF